MRLLYSRAGPTARVLPYLFAYPLLDLLIYTTASSSSVICNRMVALTQMECFSCSTY